MAHEGNWQPGGPELRALARYCQAPPVGGGYDTATDDAIQAVLDAIEKGVLDRSKVWTDIAAVMEPQMPDNIYTALKERFRVIGFDRPLFASDSEKIDPKPFIAMLRDRLQLSDAEWD